MGVFESHQLEKSLWDSGKGGNMGAVGGVVRGTRQEERDMSEEIAKDRVQPPTLVSGLVFDRLHVIDRLYRVFLSKPSGSLYAAACFTEDSYAQIEKITEELNLRVRLAVVERSAVDKK